jgi:DNA-binding IclR family transcriptional regulator
VSGVGVTVEQIAQAAGIPAHRVLESIQGLVDAGYLTPVGDGTYQMTLPGDGRRP